jgi:hypothetical protein
VADLTPEEQALHEQLIKFLFNEQDCPTPVHFAARAEIRALRAQIVELKKKHAKGEKGSTAETANKSE